MALLDGAKHTGEYLLRLRAAIGAVAATDFAGDDGGAQGLFGAPVGRIDRGVEQKGEDRREFDRQVRGKALRDPPAARPIDEGIELVLEMAARDGDPVRRDRVLAPAIAHPQGLLEDAADAWRKGPLLMIADEHATAAEQMREAGLMNGVLKLAIRGPAVAHQDTVEVCAEHRGGLIKAAAPLNRVHRRLRCGKAPQPLQMAADFPAGFIRGDDRTAANGLAQGPVRGFGLPRGPADRVDEPARGDAQAEAFAEQRRDLAERQPELFVQHDGQHDGFRTELRGGGAQRVRRLQRMTPLHAPPALPTVADGHVEDPHDRAHDREIFLRLRRVTVQAKGPATVWTGGRQRCVVRLIDVGGNGSVGLPAVGGPRLAARSTRPTSQRATRKGRCLPMDRPPRGVQFLFEPVNLSSQPIAFLPEPIPLAPQLVDIAGNLVPLMPQPLVVALLPFDLGDKVVTSIRAPARVHALVMPRFDREYKWKLRRSRRSDVGSEVTTR